MSPGWFDRLLGRGGRKRSAASEGSDAADGAPAPTSATPPPATSSSASRDTTPPAISPLASSGPTPPPPAMSRAASAAKAAGADSPASAPAASRDEAWLQALVTDLANGRGRDRVPSPELWARLDALVAAGHSLLAAEWLDKLIAAAPDRADELRARAVELRADRGELAEALDHLEALTANEAYAPRAHFLLAEHHDRRGDAARALRHLEAVLSYDLDYPNARARAEALLRRRGTFPAPSADETVASPSGVAAGRRYRLVRELGRGATAAVYLARDLELERDVAVKLLHPHLAAGSQAGARARFFAEARVAASLRHPHIVGIYDLDEDTRRIVMELGAGGTLRDRLSRGPLPVDVALARHAEVLSALSAAHRRGVVHRDLKPANLLFRRDPDAADSEVMLADFGVAHLVRAAAEADRRQAPRAGERELLGTLPFMAPEQRRGEEVTPAADLYAAAVILYESIAGRLPWDRETALRGIRGPRDLELPAHPRISRHLLALGHPDPAQRPTTEEALADALALS